MVRLVVYFFHSIQFEVLNPNNYLFCLIWMTIDCVDFNWWLYIGYKWLLFILICLLVVETTLNISFYIIINSFRLYKWNTGYRSNCYCIWFHNISVVCPTNKYVLGLWFYNAVILFFPCWDILFWKLYVIFCYIRYYNFFRASPYKGDSVEIFRKFST